MKDELNSFRFVAGCRDNEKLFLFVSGVIVVNLVQVYTPRPKKIHLWYVDYEIK